MRTTHRSEDDHGTIVPETPLRLLIKTYPDLAELVFNNCISKAKVRDPSDPEDSPPIAILSMNYEFIDDAFFIKAPEDEEGMNLLFFLTELTVVSVISHCRYSKAYKRHTKGKNFVIFISRICLLNLEENAF